MLPSEAKRTLIALILERLESSKLDCYGNPMYRYVNFLHEFNENILGGWLNAISLECFEIADKEYNRKHPLCWDNEKQHSYRDDFSTGRKDSL